MGHTSLSAIALTTARDWASVAVALGAGLEPPLRVKSSKHWVESKSFYSLEVRLNITVHFKFYSFWLQNIRMLT